MSSSATFLNPLTTSKTLNTPKNTGEGHTKGRLLSLKQTDAKLHSRHDFNFLACRGGSDHLFCLPLLRLTLSALGIKLNEYWKAQSSRRAGTVEEESASDK